MFLVLIIEINENVEVWLQLDGSELLHFIAWHIFAHFFSETKLSLDKLVHHRLDNLFH